MFPVSARRQAGPGSQRGMTLIEALAAFVILSVGLLGIVGLQALSKTAQHQAIQRSRAVALGNDMLERIRSNPAGLETYDIHLAPQGVAQPLLNPAPIA
ncbi:type IV pilus modification protein PilV [Kineobactrum salinum]|uniref:Type IV pilus modification protein PilV n=2 Tax=Kineobactrum salinum TaxID=2708301 RepID=A0A6C0TY69_9GAMM|nr:type IV pilus modification protein PilV [Kineobactrum salinum]QIB64782.1 type IV pilus modification protein PilV [Kineobactrum salinum]